MSMHLCIAGTERDATVVRLFAEIQKNYFILEIRTERLDI